MRELWLATGNAKKRAELERLLASLDVRLRTPDELSAPFAPVEDQPDFAGNARVKAQALAVLTRGASGSAIVTAAEVIDIDPHPVAQLVDTTGAGDLYAAGFLYGYTNGHALDVCGQLASLAAAEIISHLGARPETSLAELASTLLAR